MDNKYPIGFIENFTYWWANRYIFDGVKYVDKHDPDGMGITFQVMFEEYLQVIKEINGKYDFFQYKLNI